MRLLSTLVMIIGFPILMVGQYFPFFQQEYFFGWLPNPATDAMGRTEVAIGGTVASIFHNPAGIGLIADKEIAFSTSGRYYALRKSDYYFLGAAWRFHPRMVGAFSINHFGVGPTSFDININGTNYPTDKPSETNFAFTFSGEPVKNLQAGLNINITRWKYIKEVSAAKALHLDLGLLYTIKLTAEDAEIKRRVQAGFSITNMTATDFKFNSPMGDQAQNEMPVIARFGLAYVRNGMIKLPGANEGALDLTFSAEYNDLLNSPVRTSFHLGAEAVLYEIFAFRLGFYTRNEDDMGFNTNKSRISPFTYGFGIILPVYKLSNAKVPFNIHFDLTSMNQPPLTTNSPFIPNMRSFGFRLVWVKNETKNENPEL